ncbi:MAG: hypothetical protein IT236_11975 [Bacteroidia bacterium]|nr:hypothetical protein [Bacteroidia bacterium]
MALNTRQFNKFYWLSSALVFVLVFLRCWQVPMAHDEVATFNFYIQPGNFIPFLSHVDAMGHFLSTATAWLSFKVFGSSALALRLPVLLSFLVLVFAVFKLNNLFTSTVPKIILTFAFIFSYNFISFFSLCRGYGMSMAFLMLALFYFYSYARHFSFRHLAKFVGFSQLALSANLTLVFVLLITTGILVALQLKNKLFFTFRNIILLVIHLALIGFWVKFAFFLQDSGALYYGGGDSYWTVTFLSLIELMTLKNTLVTLVVVLLFGIMLAYFIKRIIADKLEFIFTNRFALSFISLVVLMIAFYLLKKLFHVNYPEDRAGLFFYAFFILSLCYLVNELKRPLSLAFLAVPLFFVIQLAFSYNTRVHPWRIYETIPQRFYDLVSKEQQQSAQPITIAGTRLKEFIFGFLNYNGTVKLSHMTSPEQLQMNADYAVAYASEKQYYEPYYTEIAKEDDWNFRLLKRKTPIERELIYASQNNLFFTGNYEYYNAYERLDTTYNSNHPLMAEFELSVKKAPVPLNAWLVLQMDAAGENENSQFVRVPLNLINYNWNGISKFKTCVLAGNTPLKVKRVVCYLWNIDQQEIDINIHSFRLFRLNGAGVTETSKTSD